MFKHYSLQSVFLSEVAASFDSFLLPSLNYYFQEITLYSVLFSQKKTQIETTQSPQHKYDSANRRNFCPTSCELQTLDTRR